MLPQLFCQRMQQLLGAEYEEFLAAYLRPRNTALRFNPLKGPAADLPFTGEAVPWEPNGRYLSGEGRPGLHPLHDAGLYYLQEPSAMAPAGLLDIHPGQRVLDLCAAPGGKTTQLAAAMGGEGLLVCNEIHPKRARILAGNIERLGIVNALVLNEHPAKLAERFPGFFDRILVDAPCSGEGMFRKEEDAVTDWSPETVAMCAARQSEILLSAAQMLAPGGRLVYSTCTFAPEENEGSISRLLAARPELAVAQVPAPWFAPGRPDWVDAPCPGLEHTFRLWPHRLRGEGHFAAVLENTVDGIPAPSRLQPEEALPREAADFLEAHGVTLPEGRALCFGETVYWAPPELPALRGLKVLRTGLELGEVRKGRFVPAHALALWLRAFPCCADFPADSREIAAYLRGETLIGPQSGWVLVRADGYSLGWAKGAGGVLKNHYPKGLRRL
ncbi:MAG: RsmB/NOP family class I SAM-dependent RNA methyltransferase [Oscillospiraceae bacterium]|nr:RsmB/NOP family class I SAM-dependent RNA methyltransferase [Oscillospiraceae bacterium]